MNNSIKITSINSIHQAIFYHNLIINNDKDTIVIDFKNASFIRNNFISIVGMGIEIAKDSKKKIIVKKSLNIKVNRALANIGFFSKYCTNTKKEKDIHGTMIPYSHVPLTDNSNEITKLYSYFTKRLQKHMGNHSIALQKIIFKKILEIFSNVFRHSQSELGLICSGQFFPNNKKFNFTIVDCGVGIDKNVNNYLISQVKDDKKLLEMKQSNYQILNGHQSIQWAIQNSHSSTGRGGLGLSLLIDLVEKSDGALEIISNNGYYARRKSGKRTKLLAKPFLGTIVSVELNASEDKYFYLKEEKK
ncbi:hypothetical protein OAR97_02575 [Arcobacteraceae bacterium]|nr:hypothetical protein [Arcobacteraceae bacterium]